MSAGVMLKSLHKVSGYPLAVLRAPFVACYHTERGVFGYRPRRGTSEEPDGELLNTHSSLNQDHGLARLVDAYRTHGHKAAKINPLMPNTPVLDKVPEISILNGSLSGTLRTSGLRHFGKAEARIEEVVAYLEDTYCGRMSVETSQLQSLEERVWLADRFEELKKESFTAEERRQLAKIMLESQVLQMNHKLESVLTILVEQFQLERELLQKPSHCSSRLTKRQTGSMEKGQRE